MSFSRDVRRRAGLVRTAAGRLVVGTLLLGMAAVAAARGVDARTLRVPEDRASIDLAAADAVDGDTLSLATGSYTRVPAPISKAIVVRGRGDTPEETILAGLFVGRARIENLTFELIQPLITSLVLIEPRGSLTIADCLFRGFAVGVAVAVPAMATDDVVRLERCRFQGPIQGIDVVTNSTVGPRVDLVACTFSGGSSAVALSRPPESCTGSDTAPPPALNEAAALVRMTGCVFEDLTEVAVNLSTVPDALSASGCTFRRCGTPLRLRLAGAALTDCTFIGTNRTGRGIDMEGARIDLSSCEISGFEYGIAGFPFANCRDSGGRIGPTPVARNRLGGNTIALAGGPAFEADYNFWGLLTCGDVNAALEPTTTGSPRVRVLLDENGNAVADCSTAVEATTWGALKARFAGPEARH